MRSLSVKNMPDALYQRLRDHARRHHRSISQEVVHLLSQALEAEATLSILGLIDDADARGVRRSARGLD